MHKIKKLRIGGVDYKVKLKKDLKDGSTQLWGQVVYAKCKIEIEDDMALSRKQNVLIHECTHAIFHESGYFEDNTGVHTEAVINDIGNTLHSFLKDNIEVLYALYKGDKN